MERKEHCQARQAVQRVLIQGSNASCVCPPACLLGWGWGCSIVVTSPDQSVSRGGG